MMKKRYIILISIASILFLILAFFAVKIGIQIHNKITNTPEYVHKAKEAAINYIESNDELKEKYGENFEYKTGGIHTTVNKELTFGTADIKFSIGNDNYKVYLELIDGEWFAKEIKVFH